MKRFNFVAMKCAIVKDEVIKSIDGFCDEIEELVLAYYGSQTEDNRLRLTDALIKYRAVFFKVRHLVTAYQTVYENACDPTTESLEFRPDLLHYVENKESIDKKVAALDQITTVIKTYVPASDNDATFRDLLVIILNEKGIQI